MSFLTKLIGAGISLALLWGAVQLVGVVIGNMDWNFRLTGAEALVHPDLSWKAGSSVTHQAGFSCDDKAHQCPSETKTYTSIKPVTPAQVKASVVGNTTPVQGDCQHGQANQPLCTMHFHSASQFDYDTTVTGSPGNYTITISLYKSNVK